MRRRNAEKKKNSFPEPRGCTRTLPPPPAASSQRPLCRVAPPSSNALCERSWSWMLSRKSPVGAQPAPNWQTSDCRRLAHKLFQELVPRTGEEHTVNKGALRQQADRESRELSSPAGWSTSVRDRLDSSEKVTVAECAEVFARSRHLEDLS